MGLFKADLYRNFAIGFGAGALIVGAMTADNWKQEFDSRAHAAELTAQQQQGTPAE